MDWKGFVVDHLGHFDRFNLWNGLFDVAAAALIGAFIGKVGAGMEKREARQLAGWAVVGALAIAFSRTQLPMALALLALVLVVRDRSPGPVLPLLPLAGTVVLGAGCGSGASIPALLFGALFVLLLRWSGAGAARQ